MTASIGPPLTNYSLAMSFMFGTLVSMRLKWRPVFTPVAS